MNEKTIIIIIIIIAIVSIFMLHYINTTCKPIVKVYPGCPEIKCTPKHDDSKIGKCLKECDISFDKCFNQCHPKDNDCIKNCYKLKANCYMQCTDFN